MYVLFDDNDLHNVYCLDSNGVGIKYVVWAYTRLCTARVANKCVCVPFSLFGPKTFISALFSPRTKDVEIFKIHTYATTGDVG